jgi:hypothetical protein
VSKIDDGGYAFPRAATETNNPNMFFEPQEGMTLRDYFAAAALQGWLASFGPEAPHPALKNAENEIATLSYRVADAMIEARKEEA